jgi:ubiquinone/menaquinone biosynthesis C-methylase UbiE
LKKEVSVTGADISPELLKIAKSKKSSIEFINTSAENLSTIKENNFDKVFCYPCSSKYRRRKKDDNRMFI